MNTRWVLIFSTGAVVALSIIAGNYLKLENETSVQTIRHADFDNSKIAEVGTLVSTEFKENPPMNILQSGAVDEHLSVDNTLRDINFCGTIYQTETVFVDGVDILQKVADLAQEKNVRSTSTPEAVKTFSTYICSNTTYNKTGDLGLEKVSVYARDLPPEMMTEKNKTYGIYTRMFQISITPFTNTIDTVSFFDGEHSYLTNLK